ncbi:hypothetical protein Pmani_001981 [Petrolisthes manimaculis]|uniref:Uncharacterized protein n=1 Tax=Petrolisthes manimaculis TaxID=1843537 RepID=A0AAE1URH0_9EUCA|nr:hypothetical protein Pmani_001981 [Petrolisthes manimaculis]
MRAFQLHALSRHAAWTVFATNDSLVPLSPVPLFQAKYEREGHSLLPFTISAWFIAHCVQFQRLTLTYFPRKLHHGRISLCSLILSGSVPEFRLLKNCARSSSQRIQGNVPKATMCVKWLPPSTLSFSRHYLSRWSVELYHYFHQALPSHSG